MKINESHRHAFKEVVKKHKIIKEGFLANLFKKSLKSKLTSSPDLMSAIKKADKDLDDYKKLVADMKKSGVTIPKWVKL